jgi:hypothetical protein
LKDEGPAWITTRKKRLILALGNHLNRNVEQFDHTINHVLVKATCQVDHVEVFASGESPYSAVITMTSILDWGFSGVSKYANALKKINPWHGSFILSNCAQVQRVRVRGASLTLGT